MLGLRCNGFHVHGVDLSFLFTIFPGEKVNSYLDTEYLAVLETDNDTPYYLNLHCGEVGHSLILGMTGSGKTFLSVFLVQNAQKYNRRPTSSMSEAATSQSPRFSVART